MNFHREIDLSLLRQYGRTRSDIEADVRRECAFEALRALCERNIVVCEEQHREVPGLNRWVYELHVELSPREPRERAFETSYINGRRLDLVEFTYRHPWGNTPPVSISRMASEIMAEIVNANSDPVAAANLKGLRRRLR